jgi:dihydrofolate reductase
MLLSLVVAASTNNAIGLYNKLLWHLPNDLKFFKNITWAMPVVMGRKTFEALAGKPLPGRLNMVITRQKDFTADGITVVRSLEEASELAAKADYKELYVIGGGEIYRQAILVADKIYITRVDAELVGDAYFPAIDPEHWVMVSNRSFEADAKHAYAYHFQLWERNKAKP